MRAKLASTVLAILFAAGCGGAGATPTPSASVMPHPSDSASPTPTPSPNVSPSPTVTAGPTFAPTLAWKDCGGGLQCADLEVPLDYANPTGSPIRLALLRRPATDPAHRIGSIVVNPGGPGGSGNAFVRREPKMFGAAVMARFDIVGFDPRGVGSSSPVHCLNQRPVVAPAAPDNATETAKIVDSATAVTAACEANSGDVLPYLGTWNVARDLEQIRIALGDDKLTYVGWSYGTLIGALYASLFPTHIRAMVLDGVVDPNLDLRQFDLDQAVAFQRQFNKFFAYCAGRTQCPFHSHGKPRAAFDALMAKLDADPRILSERDAVYGIMTYLSDDNLSGLGAALAAAAKGNGSRLRDAGAMSASFLDGFDAVFCADYAASRDPETYASMAADLAKAAPDFGAPNAYFNFDCVYWPFQSQRVPARVSARGAPPILIISATGDPNTPHAWGKSLAGQLSSSVLLTRDGDGHTSMFRSACVRTAAERYIVKLATPRKGTTCK